MLNMNQHNRSKTITLLPILSIVLLFGFLYAIPVHAADFPQPPSAVWSTTPFPETTGFNATAYSLKNDSTGYIAAGRLVAETTLNSSSILVKLNENGVSLLSNTFNEDNHSNEARSIIPVTDGYVLTGYKFRNFLDGDGHEWYDHDVWIMKTKTDLTKDWDNTFGDPYSDWGNSIIPYDDGFIIGGMHSIGDGLDFSCLIRTDNSGDSTAHWEIATDPMIGQEINSVEQTSEHGLILGTSTGIIKLTSSNPPTLEWKATGNHSTDTFFSVKQLSDGTYIGVGKTLTAPGAGGLDDNYDLILVKLDSTGNIVWSRIFGRNTPALFATNQSDVGRDIVQTPDNGYAIIGTTGSYGWHGGTDAWLIKTDSQGNMEWDLSLGDSGYDNGYSLVLNSDGSYTVAGNVHWEEYSRMWIAKIGNTNFSPPVPSFTYMPESPFYFTETASFDAAGSSDDGTIVKYDWDFGDGTSTTGSSPTVNHKYTTPGYYTVMLYVTDNHGIRRETSHTLSVLGFKRIWEKKYGDHDIAPGMPVLGNLYGRDLVSSPDGGFVMCGQIYPELNEDGSDLWVHKTDGQGEEIWERAHSSQPLTYSHVSGKKIIPANDGGYIVLGHRERRETNEDNVLVLTEKEIWLVKIEDSAGDIIWEKYIRSDPIMNTAYDIYPADGGYIITGQAGDFPYTSGESSIFLIKTDNGGNVEWNKLLITDSTNDPTGKTVRPTSDGGYIVTGGYGVRYSPHGDHSTGYKVGILTVKTDSTGNEQWRSDLFIREAIGTFIHEYEDSMFFLAGVAGWSDTLMTFFDLSDNGTFGENTWSRTRSFDTSLPKQIDRLNNGAATSDGGYVFVGALRSPHYSKLYDLYFTKTDSQGEPVWAQTIDFDDTYPPGNPQKSICGGSGLAVIPLEDGSYVILAYASTTKGSTRLFKLGTDQEPVIEAPDTDGDCLPDSLEDRNGNGMVDPDETDPHDADTDDDGLLDGNCGSEDLNANGMVDPGETSPANPDSDGDGIYDGTEKGLTAPEVAADTDISKGFFIADADPSTVTDPTNPDSDGDGISDGEEDLNKNGAVDPGETSPKNEDSDGDGYSDGEEKTAGTSPLDSKSIPTSGNITHAGTGEDSGSGGSCFIAVAF